LRFAQAAFIFTDKAFFCAAVMGLRFAADAGIPAAFAVLPAGFRFAATKLSSEPLASSVERE
jgi:hypothetical protein